MKCPFPRTIMFTLAASVIASCSGSSDSQAPGPTFTVSGQILADPIFQVDSDLNDNATVPVSNNTFSSAQPISTETEVRGYVNNSPTGRLGDNFGVQPDDVDIFAASLEAGQVITLRIADFIPGGFIDLDIYLFNELGTLVSSSISFSSAFEQIPVTAAGQYFIAVDAFEGASNYSLTISDGATTPPLSSVVANVAMMAPDSLVTTSSDAAAFSPHLTDLHGAPFSLSQTSPSLTAGTDKASAIRSAHISPAGMKQPVRGPLSMGFPQKASGITPAQALSPTYRDKLALLHHIKEVNHKARADILYPSHYKKLHADPPPNPSLQWNLPLIKWEEALDTVEAALPSIERPIIAVLDSGVLSDHPAIAPVLVDARDFVPSFIDGDGFDAGAEEDVNPNDTNSADCFDFHGTHVASSAVAPVGTATINGVTMVGALPFADLMMIKLGYSIDPECRLIVGDVAGAIRYAAGLPNSSGALPDKPADVINMSFGGDQPNLATEQAIKDAVAAGVIIVASSGNDGDAFVAPPPSYPAAFEDVFAVAATDINGNRAFYSSFYPQVEIAAPGGDGRFDFNTDGFADAVLGGIGVLNNPGTDFIPRYTLYQGTSMAAPHVAAGFALMKAIYPQLTSDEAHRLVEEGLLTDDVDAPGRDNNTGYGLMSLKKMADVALQLRQTGLDLPPDFALVPGAINLGNLSETATLTITRLGEPDFSITSLTFTGAGLSPDQLLAPTPTGNVDSAGFGTYTVAINRAAIAAGSYVAQVSVTSSADETKTVPVTFTIPSASLEASTGPARLRVERQVGLGFTAVSETLLGQGAGDNFTIGALPSGDYRLIFSTDMDNDGQLCDPGELGGTFPGGDCSSTETFRLPGAQTSAIEAILERLPN